MVAANEVVANIVTRMQAITNLVFFMIFPIWFPKKEINLNLGDFFNKRGFVPLVRDKAESGF